MRNRKIFWCSSCLNMSTRNRITFNDKGECNACQWRDEKESMDWGPRQAELIKLLEKFRSTNGNFDCIVPVSGGKDGSYVSRQLKHKYGMNPLTITVKPALSLEIGDQNLSNFIQSGFSHMHISCNPLVMDRLNKYGFIEKGFPYYGWLIAITTAVIRIAFNFKIPLIFYGENGEVEYGGDTQNKDKGVYDLEYLKSVYLEGGHEKVLEMIKADGDISCADLSFFQFPEKEQLSEVGVSLTHWSYYEPWDSYRNYVVAKEKCGLVEKAVGNSDTFTNFAQNDQALYSLHAYLMYLKFGFGRATQDAGIEIRRGAMTRDQAINLVKMYDNAYPGELIDTFTDYYNMTKDEFDAVLDRHVNKNLFEKKGGIWHPKFEVAQDFYY